MDNSSLDVSVRNSMAITLNILTKSHTVRGRPTLKLVERFGPGGGGVLPIMSYTGSLRSKGAPFSGFKYIKG